uniref:Holliday junction resolvase n=1 Tax=uncultured organism TaxID=155900 RepID=A0A068FP14_9ZZZZ|nr:Holliday junction resolvase [uncultured organism]
MPVVSIEDLPDLLVPGMTVAGLDLGTETIGLAVSDLGLALANPREVIRRKKFTLDVGVLLGACARDRVGALVIGLPVNMDGTEGPRAQATRAFVRNMLPKTDLPIVFWDERLSTVAAQKALIEMDVSRKKRAGRVDSAAASFILQGALDRLAVLDAASSVGQ